MSRLLPVVAVLAALLSTPGCAHDTSLNARVAGAEELVREAEGKLKAADRLVKSGEDLDKAGDLLSEARELTQEPAMAYYADRENLEDRIAQAGSRLKEARDARRRREIAAKVPQRKEKGDELLVDFRAAADQVQDRGTLDRKKVGRAREALDAANKFLADSKELEIDSDWAAWSAAARKELGSRTVQVALAESVLAFHDGPVAQSAEGKKLFDQGKSAKGEQRTSLLTRARDAYLACGKDAAALMAQTPTLEREQILLSASSKTTAKAFAAACEAQAKSIDGLLGSKPAAAAKPGAAAKPPPPADPAAPAVEPAPAAGDEKPAPAAKPAAKPAKKPKKK